MNIVHKAVLPRAYRASGLASGLKKSGKLDLALFYSDLPAITAGMFTTNTISAAPVILCREYLKKSKTHRAIIANSGNANCFTGKAGLIDAKAMAKAVAEAMDLKREQVLVGSTGVIGRKLDVSKIENSVPLLADKLSYKGIKDASRAIMTTDLFPKEITVHLRIGGKMVTICGVAKGAGMIAPKMATMFAFIFTDAAISRTALNKALKTAVEASFNCITVDGCMSTNDTVLLMANAAAENKIIDSGKDYELFLDGLKKVTLELAKLMVKDGEGASKFITIKVKRGRSFSQARRVALDIANSNLFKTAMYGENPNFGRIVASVGASRVGVKEKDISIKVSSLKKKEIFVEVDINQGRYFAVVYTSDLTPAYIKINAAYN